jgi:large subunit ribosomal protein L37Ae
MFSHTKKVGSAGRYGVRIGKKVREELKKVEESVKKEKKCPVCGKSNTVRRKSAGVWECRPCKSVFAGSAYSPKARGRKAESEMEAV